MKVHADLLALATPPGLGGGDAATALLRTLRMAAPRGGEAEHGGEAGRGGRVTKSIVDAYNETYTTLLRYCCNVMTAESVAPVWTRLANCHKSEQHTVLTQELQKVCVARGLSSELAICPNHHYCPQANGRRFQFVGHGVDDLSSGCQPFLLVAYAGSTPHHYMALADAKHRKSVGTRQMDRQPHGLPYHTREIKNQVPAGHPGGRDHPD